MKTSSKRRLQKRQLVPPSRSRKPSAGGLLLFAAFLLLCAPAFAQNEPRPASGKTGNQGERTTLDLAIKDWQFQDETGQKKEATIGNLVDFARAKFHQNIVMSPGVASMRIENLALQKADMQSFFQALTVASGGSLNGHPIGGSANEGPNTWALMGRPSSGRKVEVFNLSGYLQRMGNKDQTPQARLEELERIIIQTATQLMRRPPAGEDEPSFQFHPGANLFIVIGSEEMIEIARKVVTALPGQPGPLVPMSGFGPAGPGMPDGQPGGQRRMPTPRQGRPGVGPGQQPGGPPPEGPQPGQEPPQ